MNRTTVFRTTSQFGLFLFALSLPISHVPAQFGTGFAMVGWLFEGLVNKRWNVRWHPAFIPLVFYLAWNVLAAALSERPAHSLGAVLDNEWPLFIMLMLYWTVEDPQFLKRLMYVFFVSSAVAVVYSLWQAVGGLELYRGIHLDPMGWGFYRAVGFYGFYLTFAAFAMTVFFLSSSYSFEFKKWPFILLAALSFLAVIGTFARSIWLSFFAATPMFAFARSRKAGLVVTISLLVLIVLGFVAVPALRYRAESILEPGQNQTRLNLWKTAIKVAEHNPTLGVGEDNWDLVFERYRVNGYYDTTVHPHNDYLTVLVSSGVPGLLSFLSLWGISLASGFRAARRSQSPMIRAVAVGATYSLLGLMVGAVFQNYYGTFINCLGWWFVVGLLLVAQKLGTADLPVSRGA